MSEEQKTITNFLRQHDIKFFPINLTIENGKKKLNYTMNYMPKPTDFKEKTDYDLAMRLQFLDDYDYIAIDTSDVYQIDVDTYDHQDEVAYLKDDFPYFESATKKLPHFFVTCENKIENQRVQSVLEGIEVLTGQWSYCHKNAIVYNSEKEIKNLKEEFFQPKESKK